MKRSGDVTAAAIILFFGSGFLIVVAAFVILASLLASQSQPGGSTVIFALAAVYGIPAAWGVVNGIGILKLRPWARISMIVMSALAACFQFFIVAALAVAPVLTKGDPEFRDMPMGTVWEVSAVVASIPLALATWWLILFTRKRVVAEFANRGTARPSVVSAPFDASIQSSVEPQFTSAPAAQTGFAPRLPTDSSPTTDSIPLTSPRRQLSYRRPVSITVIAVLLLFGAVSIPFLLVLPPNMRMTMMFGVFLVGWKFLVVSVCWCAAALVLGIGLLLLKEWGRIGAILYCIVGIVNTVLTVPRMGCLMDAMLKSLPTPVPPPTIPAAFMRIAIIIGFIVGIGANLVGLYFLITRRAAFLPLPPENSSGAIAKNSGAPSPSTGHEPAQ